MIKYRRTAFGIVMRRHQPARLVIEEQPRALALWQRFAADSDDVAHCDIERGRIDHPAVDGNAPLRDPLLRIAPRTQACTRHDLGDAFAALVLLRRGARRAFFPIALEARTPKPFALALETLAALRAILARTRKTRPVGCLPVITAR